MPRLDASIRRVILQFSFSKHPEIVPSGVRHIDAETPDGSEDRKGMPIGGVALVEPTMGCSLLEFPGDLEDAEYELVDGLYQERVDYRDRALRRRYHMMRFLFVPRECVRDSCNKSAVRATMREELKKIFSMNLWRVRVFLNPLFEAGQVIEGQYALSVNLEVRQPLFLPDGSPEMRWCRDERGNKVGEAPAPLGPSSHLRIVESGDVLAVPAAR